MSGVDAPAPWRIAFDNARDPYTARNALGAEKIGGGGGGGGGAPDNAEYIVAATDATLTAERVLTDTASITWDFTTPGQAKASTTAGGGNVSNSGTPVLGQYAKWVTATTIQGVSAATVLGDIGAQPLDADLTAIAALTGTNTIYYRSAANTWSPVVISTGLSFSGGTLTCTVSAGGNVSNSGTPTAGQYAKWVTATTIQGVAPATVLSDIGAQPAGSYQPLDATLTALAAYNTNGLLTQTAADTFTGRTLTGPAAGITVSNGNGVAGNPTLALANDLAALEALAGTNTIYYRSGSDAWTAVTIGTGLTFTSGTLAATGGGGTATPGPPQGRLTLQSATPVMTATTSLSTVIYYSRYTGDQVPIYDGTTYVMTTIGEPFCNLSDTSKNPAAIGASKVNDWFIWNDAGTIRLGHGPDWTSDTVRSAGTALVRVNGLWLNNAAITNGPAASRGTYVGTTRSNASSQLNWILGGNDTAAILGVWNAYNRVVAIASTTDTTASYTYNSTTIRQKRASANNSISFVSGLQEDAATAFVYQFVSNTTDTTTGVVGIGVDSTTVLASFAAQGVSLTNAATTAVARHQELSAIGYHAWNSLEACNAASNVTFFGPLAGPPARTMSGMVFEFKM